MVTFKEKFYSIAAEPKIIEVVLAPFYPARKLHEAVQRYRTSSTEDGV